MKRSLYAILALLVLLPCSAARAQTAPVDALPTVRVALTGGTVVWMGDDGLLSRQLRAARMTQQMLAWTYGLAFDGSVFETRTGERTVFQLRVGVAAEHALRSGHDSSFESHFLRSTADYAPRPDFTMHHVAGRIGLSPTLVVLAGEGEGLELQVLVALGVGAWLFDLRGTADSAPLLDLRAGVELGYVAHGPTAGIAVVYQHAFLFPIGPAGLSGSSDGLCVQAKLGWRF